MSKIIKNGLLLALLTALISGFSVFYNKIVVIKGIDPLIFNIIKNGGVAIFLSFFIFSPFKISLSKKEISSSWKKMLLVGAVGGSIPFILFFEGLKQISAIEAQLLNKTLFVWVGLLAVIFLKEKLSIKQILGFLVILYANFFIGGFKGMEIQTGHILVISATVLWSIEAVLVKSFLKKSDATVYAWSRMTFGTIFLIIAAFATNKISLLFSISPNLLIPILGSIIFLTGYVTAFYNSLKRLPASQTTAVLILAAPITNILSAIFISKNIFVLDHISTLLLLIGVLLITNIGKSKIENTSKLQASDN